MKKIFLLTILFLTSFSTFKICCMDISNIKKEIPKLVMIYYPEIEKEKFFEKNDMILKEMFDYLSNDINDNDRKFFLKTKNNEQHSLIDFKEEIYSFFKKNLTEKSKKNIIFLLRENPKFIIKLKNLEDPEDLED
jgi:uncharacterized membrane protein YgaE (UPF0421/DUF939 family)